ERARRGVLAGNELVVRVPAHAVLRACELPIAARFVMQLEPIAKREHGAHAIRIGRPCLAQPRLRRRAHRISGAAGEALGYAAVARNAASATAACERRVERGTARDAA